MPLTRSLRHLIRVAAPVLIAAGLLAVLSGCGVTAVNPGAGVRSSGPAATLNARAHTVTTLSGAKNLARAVVPEYMRDSFRSDAFRTAPTWDATVSIASVEASGPGRFIVTYEVTATTTIEPRLRQRLTDSIELGPNARGHLGTASEWGFPRELKTLTPIQQRALLAYLVEQGDPTVQWLSRLDATPGAVLRKNLVAAGRARAFRPTDLIWLELGDEGADDRLLGWGASHAVWVPVPTPANVHGP